MEPSITVLRQQVNAATQMAAANSKAIASHATAMQDMLKDINQHTETIQRWANVVESVHNQSSELKGQIQTLQRQLATSIDNNTTFAGQFAQLSHGVTTLQDKVNWLDHHVRILINKVDFLEEIKGAM